MNKATSLLFTLLILSTVIVIHELGHFFACKIFNVETPVFSIGFGTPLLQMKLGSTTFQIAALPLGGYVSMKPEDLNQKAYWQKMVITLAGVFNNFLLTFFMLLLLFICNRHQLLSIITRVKRGSPADQAGLSPGDRILAFNDETIETGTELIEKIQMNPHQKAFLTIGPADASINRAITIGARSVFGRPIGYIGIELQQDTKSTTSLIQSIHYAFETTGAIMVSTLKALWSLFRPQKKRTDQAIKSLGFKHLNIFNIQKSSNYFLFFVAILSTEIGIFNILPIPMLDGGHAAQYTIQKLAGIVSSPAQSALPVILFLGRIRRWQKLFFKFLQ